MSKSKLPVIVLSSGLFMSGVFCLISGFRSGRTKHIVTGSEEDKEQLAKINVFLGALNNQLTDERFYNGLTYICYAVAVAACL